MCLASGKPEQQCGVAPGDGRRPGHHGGAVPGSGERAGHRPTGLLLLHRRRAAPDPLAHCRGRDRRAPPDCGPKVRVARSRPYTRPSEKGGGQPLLPAARRSRAEVDARNVEGQPSGSPLDHAYSWGTQTSSLQAMINHPQLQSMVGSVALATSRHRNMVTNDHIPPPKHGHK
jgi:hypothetical protein